MKKNILLLALICLIILTGCSDKSKADKLANKALDQFISDGFLDQRQEYYRKVTELSDLTIEPRLKKYLNKSSKTLMVECWFIFHSDEITKYSDAPNNKEKARQLASVMQKLRKAYYEEYKKEYKINSYTVVFRIHDDYDKIQIHTSDDKEYEYDFVVSTEHFVVDGDWVFVDSPGSNTSSQKSSSSSYTTSSTDTLSKDDETLYWTIAKDEVKSRLKSPSSAKFPFSSNSDGVSIRKSGDTVTISAWVEAENSFGATIKNNFTITLKIDGSKYSVVSCDVY